MYVRRGSSARRISCSRCRCPTAGSSSGRRAGTTQDRALVLCDGGDGVAARAAERLAALGYRNVSHAGRRYAGMGERGLHRSIAGVNVPSKTLRRARRAREPHPACDRAGARGHAAAGENFVIVDGRPFAEYQKMNIPGGICCPNGELALRIRRHRTRSEDQDHRQLRGPHALHSRRADAHRFRRSQSGLRPRERHAGLGARGPRARARRDPTLSRSHSRRRFAWPEGAGQLR